MIRLRREVNCQMNIMELKLTRSNIKTQLDIASHFTSILLHVVFHFLTTEKTHRKTVKKDQQKDHITASGRHKFLWNSFSIP